jgi:GNAT superfamily N-acetyltransferase
VSEVHLREALEGDVVAVHEMARELAAFEELDHLFVASVDDFRAELFSSDSPAHVILAEVDGAIAGMALYFHTFSTFLGRTGIWLEDLYVRHDFRRLGVASALLAELERRTDGRLEWEVLDWNEGAIKLYDRTEAEPFTGWTKYRINPEIPR